MSVQAMSWALEQSVGGPGPKTVLLVLANYADADGWCFPGQERIAEESEQGLRTVQRQVALLVKLGLIETETRGRQGGGRTSNRYRLLMDEPLPANLAGKANPPFETSKPAIGDRAMPPRLAAEPLVEPSVEPSVTHTASEGDGLFPASPPLRLVGHKPKGKTRPAYTEGFEAFWAAYERKGGKYAAFREWQDALRRADAATIMAAVPGYLASEPRPKYRKDAERWLKNDCWESAASVGPTEPARRNASQYEQQGGFIQ